MRCSAQLLRSGAPLIRDLSRRCQRRIVDSRLKRRRFGTVTGTAIEEAVAALRDLLLLRATSLFGGHRPRPLGPGGFYLHSRRSTFASNDEKLRRLVA
jgi:hypothetical protein